MSFPCLPLSHYPHGLFGSVVPLTLSLALPDVLEAAESIRAYADGNCESLLSRLDSMPPGASDAQQEELDRVMKYGAKVNDPI